MEHETALRVRLTLEELLLRIQEAEDAPDYVDIITSRRIAKSFLSIKYKGKANNITVDPKVEEGSQEIQLHILEKLGLAPVWSYKNGVNLIRFSLPDTRGLRRFALLLISIVVAACLGLLGMLLPDTIRTGIMDYLLTPVFQGFIGLLNTFAGLMIFFTVSTGVFGMGNMASLNRIGKIVLKRCIISMLIISALAALLSSPFFSFKQGKMQNTGNSQLGDISEMIFSVLPKNPIQPFLDGNTMQIIFLAIFTGVVILVLGEEAGEVHKLFNELDKVASTAIGIVTKLVPLFIFVSLLRQIWAGTATELLGLWKPYGIFILIGGLIVILKLLLTAVETKVSLGDLLKKCMPAAAVGFATCSSIAAFPTAENDLVKELGVKKKLFDFAYPVSSVIFMPTTAVYFIVLVMYMAEYYEINVTVSWIVTAVILVAILAISVPPIPGAGMTCYGIMFAQLGIPAEGILIAATLAAGLDFFITAYNMMMLQLEFLGQGIVIQKKG